MPYFPGVIDVFGRPFHFFGLFASLGLLAAIWIMYAQLESSGLREKARHTVVWGIVGSAFLGSHLMSLLFYYPETLSSRDWLAFVSFWSRMSSLGGFFGGVIGLVIVSRCLHLATPKILDFAIISAVPGFVIARLGCTLAHDHLGHLSDFVLAVHYPGGSRHNLGFYEFLFNLFVLLPAVLYLRRQKLSPGAIAVTVCLLYSPVRFALDFLRATDIPFPDARYWGLTPAQYGCIVFMVVGLYFGLKIRQLRLRGLPAAESSQPPGGSIEKRARK
jgi:phosphatidylglycerol:prolipoprotein diacylglycerol transferase